jgi:hypothetical protein
MPPSVRARVQDLLAGLHPGWLLLPILARAIAWVVDPYPYFFWGDSFSYLLSTAPTWDRPIGYSVFLQTCFALSGGRLEAVILAQSLLGIATAAIYHRVARDHLGCSPRVATAVFLLVGLWPANILYEHTILTETLFAFLVSLALLQALRLLREGGGGAALGITLGLTSLVRSIGGVLAPVIGVVLAIASGRAAIGSRARQLALAALAFAAVTLPYAAIFRAYHGVAGTNAFLGRTMFPYVAPLVDPDRVEDPDLRRLLAAHRWDMASLDPEVLRWGSGLLNQMLEVLTPKNPSWWLAPPDRQRMRSIAGQDRILAKLALAAIAERPGGYLRLVAEQLRVVFLGVREAPITERLFQARDAATAAALEAESLAALVGRRTSYAIPAAAPRRLRELVATLADGRGVLLLAALASLACLARRARLGVERLLAALVLAALALSPILLQEYYGRYFHPALNLVLLLIALGIAELGPRWRVATGATLLVLQALASPGHSAPRGAVWARSNAYTWAGGSLLALEGRILLDVSPGERVPAFVIDGHVQGKGGAMAVISEDAGRDRAIDLSQGIDALTFRVKGILDPTATAVVLFDADGRHTNGAPGAPALADHLARPVTVDAWQSVSIPLAAFPRMHEPRGDDRAPPGEVDLRRITAVALLFEGKDTWFTFRVEGIAFEGAGRKVPWAVPKGGTP